MTPELLPTVWRDRAKSLRELALEAVARAYERAAHDLEEALANDEGELMTLQEAAEASGYSADHLGRMVRNGTIQNAGRHGAPRIRVGDLPRKVARAPDAPQIDATQIVRSAINEGAG